MKEIWREFISALHDVWPALFLIVCFVVTIAILSGVPIK